MIIVCPPIYCEILGDFVLPVCHAVMVDYYFHHFRPFPPFPNMCSIYIITDFKHFGNGIGMVLEMVIPWKW